jgi:hypothetical protein
MDACISVCTVIKSSIRHSSRLIPSIEFCPTNSPEDEGKLFVHSNPLEQVHIVYASVTNLSRVERLVLLHLLGATDGNVVAVRGHRNVIVCKVVDRPPVSCSEGTKMKTVQSLVIHHWSMSQSLGWMGQMRTLASLHLSISSSCIALATTAHNNKYLAP